MGKGTEFDYDYSVDQELVNENILRFFWNVSVHILFSEEFESLESNVCIAKFILSENFYDIIYRGMGSTRKFYACNYKS